MLVKLTIERKRRRKKSWRNEKEKETISSLILKYFCEKNENCFAFFSVGGFVCALIRATKTS